MRADDDGEVAFGVYIVTIAIDQVGVEELCHRIKVHGCGVDALDNAETEHARFA
jgi:hypothetical protein